MDLTPATLLALRTSFSGIFRGAYGSTLPWFERIATTVPSSSASNTYGWMNDMPGMREWLGERVINNLASSYYQLDNKTFEHTIGVKREHIEDDNLGQYSLFFSEQGRVCRKHPDSLFTTLLKDGESTTCFDSQYFFDTDHPVNPYSGTATYSNYSSSGKTLTQANFLTIRRTMMEYVGEGNQPLGIMPNLLVVPPALEGAAIKIVKNSMIVDTAGDGAIDNVTKGMADYICLPELAGEDTAWYLMDVSRMIKPFVFQNRRALNFQAKNQLSDDVVLELNEFRFYADARYNAGYTLPFLAYKAIA